LDTTSHFNLDQAVESEGKRFRDYYLWLERAMPKIFFDEVSREDILLITHSLMGFELADYFSMIHRKTAAIGLCLDSPDADLRILRQLTPYGIKNYHTYVSQKQVPFPDVHSPLRIATIDFATIMEPAEKTLSKERKETLYHLLKEENPQLTDEEVALSLNKMNLRFLLTLPIEHLALAAHLLFRAQTRDHCQYEIRYEEEWEAKGTASMVVVMAWRNTPQHHFLYSLARVVYRHGLTMKRVNATYTDPYSTQSVLVMVLSLHGSHGQTVLDVADVSDFLRELCSFKYFEEDDLISEWLVNPKVISGSMGNLLRVMVNFIHQALVNVDSNLYTIENIEEALCRHPELTAQLCQTFKLRFDPTDHNIDQFLEARDHFLTDVAHLDTGQVDHDNRRKTVLQQAMNFINHTLKTNFYRLNYTALSFRLNPKYLDEIPFERTKKFPELPYAIFFIRGMHFFGFHIRFKDLARGGLRTIYPEQFEQMIAERNQVFNECYQLALTQHKKNKDIPEAGAKGVILLYPFSSIDAESPILKQELEWLKIDPQEIERRVQLFRQEQKLEYLYHSQRCFIENLMIIVNCEQDGKIRARFILDYWHRPEYLYLGPDENMHNCMIEWIANFSKKYHYRPGGAFISSKPLTGINHREYGVTSLGVNVYMREMLTYIGIAPDKETFTIKMSGGPDGDVAGNQLVNLYHDYPHTAKLIALTDGTGTIHDDRGLDLAVLNDLFHQSKGICFYPPEKLSSGGFLVDKRRTRYPSPYIQETLCWRQTGTEVIEDWLSSSDMNHLLQSNIFQTKTDVFIPAGGRPRTLNETNIHEFLDSTGTPTARVIIEGANLYFTPQARHFLEERGALIIKDSSANKGGVISSSFEVLCGLTLDDATWIENKPTLVAEILDCLKQCALNEADLLLRTHKQTHESLTSISDRISEQINQYKYQLLDYLDVLPLSHHLEDLMICCFLNYCPPTLSQHFPLQLLSQIPDHHKKAIIACHSASHMVYKKGIGWSPSIIDIFPLILSGSPLTHVKSDKSALEHFKC
jgi:glutamate dehydrogenase